MDDRGGDDQDDGLPVDLPDPRVAPDSPRPSSRWLRPRWTSSRWLRPAAGLLAFVAGCAVATAGLTAVIAGRGGEVAVPPGTSSSADAAVVADPSERLARVAALQQVLDRRAAAVRTGRGVGWEATLDPLPAAVAFRKAQLAQFERLRLLPVRSWSYEVLGTTPSGGRGGVRSFGADVRLRYRLLGDTRDVERRYDVGLARRGAVWALTDVRRTSREADPWELAAVTVVTGRRSVVVGIGRAAAGPALRRVAADADDAAARVDTVWGKQWRRTVVVFVPSDLADMAGALGRPHSNGLERVAAVTNGELAADRAADGGAADRVVLNPTAFARLSPLGRRVVLTHELTHVATRATVKMTSPLWVEEGFADYVAYSGTGLAPGVIAADALAAVRAGTAEEHLPTADAFDPDRGPIGPAYADAWLVFDLMARDGALRPLEFYRASAGLQPAATGGTGGTDGSGGSGGTDRNVHDAFRLVTGADQSVFEVRWRAYRRSLVGTGGR